MYEPTAHDILIELLGAAALLLWGTRMVRTGVQRAFGAELRHVLRVSLSNRFAALLAGIGVIAAAFFLERVCKLPEDDDTNGGTAPAA